MLNSGKYLAVGIKRYKKNTINYLDLNSLLSDVYNIRNT